MSRYTTGAQEWESMNVADTHLCWTTSPTCKQSVVSSDSKQKLMYTKTHVEYTGLMSSSKVKSYNLEC